MGVPKTEGNDYGNHYSRASSASPHRISRRTKQEEMETFSDVNHVVVPEKKIAQSTSLSPIGPVTKMAFAEGEIASGPMWIAAVSEAYVVMNSKRAALVAKNQPKADASRSLLAQTKQRASAGGNIAGGASPMCDGRSIVSERSLRTYRTHRTYGSHTTATSVAGRDDCTGVLREPPLNESYVSFFGDDLNSTELALIRTKVAPLLLTGLLGIGGFFASIYVQSSCQFVTVMIDVEGLGGDVTNYPFLFGLWKYTPIGSVYKGDTYCERYDEDYGAPIIPLIFGLIAFFLGFSGLVVLWVYLIMGRTSELAWVAAIYALYLAAFLSSVMFFTLRNTLCQSYSCSLGPSSFVSILTTLIWLLLAYVMKNNAPASVRITAAIRTKSENANREFNERGVKSNVPNFSTSALNKTHRKGDSALALHKVVEFSSQGYLPPLDLVQ